MAKFASATNVSTDASRAEIEKTLARYGATSFLYATEEGKAIIGFRIAGRMIRFLLTLPDRNRKDFTHHSRGARTSDAAHAAWEQACRQKWRALALVIKAKLEAVDAGITTVEHEFLANTMMPDGRNVAEWVHEPLRDAYITGVMPSTLLLEAPGR